MNYLSGTYRDGMPYNGVVAQLNFKKEHWDFAAVTHEGYTQNSAAQFVKDFNRHTGQEGTDCLEWRVYPQSRTGWKTWVSRNLRGLSPGYADFGGKI